MTGAASGGDELAARVGELHRLTILYCDVVGSTELSRRWEPEAYRELMTRYRAACRRVVEDEFEGHIVQIKGDGILAAFGFPMAHENDAERAVRAGLALVRSVARLPAPAGEQLQVRVGVHHGPLYVDLDEDDVYGLAANVGSRLQSIASPGTVLLSDEVRRLVEDRFELEAGEPQVVKGVEDPLHPFRVVGERRMAVRRSWPTPLVERDRELERLHQAWEGASAAGPERVAGVVVSGEAGVGKSRLVGAFVEEVSVAGARVLELHGSPFHADEGFHPVRDLIERRCGIAEDAEPAARLEMLRREAASVGLDPDAMVPLLAPLLGIEPGAGYEPVPAQGQKLAEQIAQGALDYVLACAGEDPVLVLAENLHWFDDATCGLLAALASAGRAALLVLGTSRDREDASWEAIELRPLTPAGRLELIDALEGDLADADRRALAARSGGIPLYLEELVRAGVEVGPQTGAAGTDPAPGSVPAALYEPLVARLYVMPTVIPLAAAAAAAGVQVERSLLTATISLPEEELDAGLQSLLDAQILEPVEDRSDRYQFRHELLREVAYELQPPSWRRKVHSRLGDLLAQQASGDWRVVASHFERAERFEEAADAYRETAEAARRRGALQEARNHLAHAIELVEPLARAKLEVDLRLRRGFLAMSLEGAGSTDAAADYERCLEVAGADPGADPMFSTLISLWSYYLSRGELDRARETSVTLRSVLDGPRSYFRPPNLAGFGMLDWFAGDFASALDTLVRAMVELAALGNYGEISQVWFVPIDATVAMHVYIALARFMAAEPLAADESLARAHEHAAGLDFPQGPWSTAYAHWLGSWIWGESGRLDQASAALDDLRSASDLHGFANFQLIGATQAAAFEALAALRTGDTDATAMAERAGALGGFLDFWRALDLRIFLPFYLTTCGQLLAAAGDEEAARRRYEESRSLAVETGMHFYDAETARCVALLSSGEEERVAGLRDALELARSQAARPFELRIALDLHELLGDDAQPMLELAMAPFDADASTFELEKARARTSTPR